jgi:hypothetical protein
MICERFVASSSEGSSRRTRFPDGRLVVLARLKSKTFALSNVDNGFTDTDEFAIGMGNVLIVVIDRI